MRPRILMAAFVSFLVTSAAFAPWYDDYDAGIAAVNKGQWSAVVQKMTAAINGNNKEDNHARTYGAIFYNYHPYYYRGVAYLNLGKYEQAIKDLEQTSGPGEKDLGPIEILIQRAKSKLEASNTPEPAPAPVTAPVPPTPLPNRPPPPAPVPVPVPTPSSPSIDPMLRQRAAVEISNAQTRQTAAQGRKANASTEFKQASKLLAEARTRSLTAKSNDDLNSAIASAQNAANYFDNAMAAVASVRPTTPKPIAATELTLGGIRQRLRTALSNYFSGEFETATPEFELLSTELPQNGWIWAFLGASQYSRYAFEADEAYRTAALKSFKKARESGQFKDGLPARYFSKRIRNAYKSAG